MMEGTMAVECEASKMSETNYHWTDKYPEWTRREYLPLQPLNI